MHAPDTAVPDAVAGLPSRRPLLALTLAALAVRAAFLLLEPATQPVADERTWVDWARIIGEPRVGFSPLRTHLIFHPPLYPYFLGGLLALFDSLEAARWTQMAVTVLLVPAVGRVAGRVLGPRAGLAAAGLAAFYPELVWFSGHFWVENVFLVFTWWGFERLLAADASERVGPAAAAGVLWGLAVLTRETLLYFVPLAALWLALSRQRGRLRWTAAAALVLAAVVVVAPWTWRNWVVFRAFVPVSTAGSLNLFQGNARMSRQEVYDHVDAVKGRVQQHRYALRQGARAIRERQPAWIFEKLAEQMPLFWEAESMAVIHLKRGAYGPVTPAAAAVLGAVLLLPYLGLLALFVAGVAGAPAGRAAALLLGFLAYYNLLHVVTHGFNRYRVPVLPVLFVFAGWALASWRAGRYPRLSPRRKAVALALAAVFVASLVPSAGHLRHRVYGYEEATEPAPAEAR